MKFFKAQDFHSMALAYDGGQIAEIANEKLAQEGIVIYGRSDSGYYGIKQSSGDTVTGLLINITPIEKCAHPKEKVKAIYRLDGKGAFEFKHYGCTNCGVQVEPSAFEEKK